MKLRITSFLCIVAMLATMLHVPAFAVDYGFAESICGLTECADTNDSDPVGKLMHDFRCISAVDMFYQELATSVRHFKETEGGRSQMSKAMEERINREKDKERIDCSYECIKNLMEAMKMTAEQAMSILKIPDGDKAALSKRF